jgi:hypothetical protein
MPPDRAATEQDLRDFIDGVPFGKRLLADRTGADRRADAGQRGFAEAFAGPALPIRSPAPFVTRCSRAAARLLHYRPPARVPGPYDHLYRFADFNAGQYASRNAAFQTPSSVSGVPLALDGDLLRYDHGDPASEPGSTELAVRALARRLDLTDADIRRDLELGKGPAFARSRVYARVFALADRLTGAPVPRAVVPQIPLRSPKITRNLTSEWFASRVERRHRTCLGRMRG